ncbi:MAG: transglutaminase-like cysteine peptidase [Azospirillaceae bacterium]
MDISEHIRSSARLGVAIAALIAGLPVALPPAASAQTVRLAAYAPSGIPTLATREPRQVGSAEQLSKWRAVAPSLADLVGTPVDRDVSLDTVRAVNRDVNAVPYVSDPERWGVADRWLTPTEFRATGGDCEDYAIAKLVELRRLGVPATHLRLVVGYHRDRRAYHAVLEVQVDDTWRVLDMGEDALLTRQQATYFEPIYAIHDGALWSYVPPS